MQDSYGRICSCIRVLSNVAFLSNTGSAASNKGNALNENGEEEATEKNITKSGQASFVRELYLQLCRDSFSDMLRQKQKEEAERKKEKEDQISVQIDDLLVLRQLRANRAVGKAGYASLPAQFRYSNPTLLLAFRR